MLSSIHPDQILLTAINDYLVQKYIKETDDIIKILAENKTVEKIFISLSIRVISDDCEGLITEESVCNPTSNYGRKEYD